MDDYEKVEPFEGKVVFVFEYDVYAVNLSAFNYARDFIYNKSLEMLRVAEMDPIITKATIHIGESAEEVLYARDNGGD